MAISGGRFACVCKQLYTGGGNVHKACRERRRKCTRSDYVQEADVYKKRMCSGECVREYNLGRSGLAWNSFILRLRALRNFMRATVCVCACVLAGALCYVNECAAVNDPSPLLFVFWCNTFRGLV